MTRLNRNLILGNVALEFLFLNLCVALVIIGVLLKGEFGTGEGFGGFLWKSLLIFNLSWIIVLGIRGDYGFYLNSNFKKRTNYLQLNIFLFILIAFSLGSILQITYIKNGTFLFPVFLFAILNLLFFRKYDSDRKKGKESGPRALIIGSSRKNGEAADFSKKLQLYGFESVDILDDVMPCVNGHNHNVIGKIEELSTVLQSQAVDEIFVNIDVLQENQLVEIINKADFHGIRINLVPQTPRCNGMHVVPITLEDQPVFRVHGSPLDHFNNYFLKKLFDFVFALLVIVLLSPLYVIISILIYLDNPGPILYKPWRKGEEGKAFECYKFRTMSTCDDPFHGEKSTVKNDPRLTRIGRILRKFDLDELPQFFNVLRGDMSVVGPRPHRTFLHNDFRKIINDYMVRHYVKPGVTGWAQVNGWRGPAKTEIQKRGRISHDLWYIENWSFWLDMKIIFLTVFSTKARENAF
ncbi:MAG: exopolysaccharide biosynthesis polyprenyl glycosylphosphotransferase [Saprospiraceae bacterium]|nr:exopolysaccharide biosynthesis polyprenyl glycosylphosphotransferase [Saprospiraceae bacterium]